MTPDQALKILKDLQYRIEVSNSNDPEYAAAVRLRDRLCAKYNITLDTISHSTVKVREFRCRTREEAQVIIQYAFVKLLRKKGEFNLYSLRGKHSKKIFSVEIPMDDDEYNLHYRIIYETLELYRKRRAGYLEYLKNELSLKMKAWDTQFLGKGGLLCEGEGGEEPPWGLSEAMAAAHDLDGIVFPENYIPGAKKAELGYTL